MSGPKSKSMEERLWSKVEMKGEDDCWPWMAAISSTSGYGNFMITSKPKYQTSAHRVVLMLAEPLESYDDLEACHTCDNRACCNPKHLFWGTRQDNVDDMVRKGRVAKGQRLNHPNQVGDKNHAAKLTEQEVRQIKYLLSQGYGQSDVGRMMGVSNKLIWAIEHGKSWLHVGFDANAPAVMADFIAQ